MAEELSSEVPELPAWRKRIRITVVVDCDREMVPGWGYNPQDMADAAAARAAAVLGSYTPEVIRATYAKVAPLVDVITEKFRNLDTSMARRLIVEGCVLVNDRTTRDPAVKVVTGDAIVVEQPAKKTAWTALTGM
jgi:hypothetical protein